MAYKYINRNHLYGIAVDAIQYHLTPDQHSLLSWTLRCFWRISPHVWTSTCLKLNLCFCSPNTFCCSRFYSKGYCQTVRKLFYNDERLKSPKEHNPKHKPNTRVLKRVNQKLVESQGKTDSWRLRLIREYSFNKWYIPRKTTKAIADLNNCQLMWINEHL